jgi:hypothetical protein
VAPHGFPCSCTHAGSVANSILLRGLLSYSRVRIGKAGRKRMSQFASTGVRIMSQRNRAVRVVGLLSLWQLGYGSPTSRLTPASAVAHYNGGVTAAAGREGHGVALKKTSRSGGGDSTPMVKRSRLAYSDSSTPNLTASVTWASDTPATGRQL